MATSALAASCRLRARVRRRVRHAVNPRDGGRRAAFFDDYIHHASLRGMRKHSERVQYEYQVEVQ